jgi:hypothetical protein
MSVRKAVTSMTLGELVSKREADRINQQHSRARKQRRVENLEHQNQELIVQLARANRLLACAKRREDTLRATLNSINPTPCQAGEGDPLRAIFDTFLAVLKGSCAEDSLCGTDQCLYSTKSASGITRGQESSEADIMRPGLCSFKLSNVFNEKQADYILGLPNEFGHGSWVNLLQQQGKEGPKLQQGKEGPKLPNQFLFSNEPDRKAPSEPETTMLVRSSFHASQQRIDPKETIVPYNVDATLVPPSPTTMYDTLPLHVAPVTKMDDTLLRITSTGRQWAQRQGRQHGEVSQQSFPSILSLLNPDTDDEDEITHPIAAGLASHSLTMIVKSFPTKVAFHCMLAYLVRWFVNPCKQNYNKLPTHLRPTQLQMTVPHPAWVDTVAWYAS